MELLQLKYFCHAASNENFSKTAKKFNVPPSNISQSIKRLEKELNINLFIRQANKITLSPQGAEFHKKVSVALSLISDAVNEVNSNMIGGEISICINTNRRIVMQVIERFKKEYPDVFVKTKFFCNPTTEDFNIIISDKDDRLKNYKSQKLLSENFAVALNKNNPLSNCDKLDTALLADEPFITMNEQSSLYEHTHRICNESGFKPHIAVQSDDPYYVRKCVELGLGVAIIPQFSWQGQFADNVILKDIEGYQRDSYIYTDPQKYVTHSTKRFTEMLIHECKNI